MPSCATARARMPASTRPGFATVMADVEAGPGRRMIDYPHSDRGATTDRTDVTPFVRFLVDLDGTLTGRTSSASPARSATRSSRSAPRRLPTPRCSPALAAAACDIGATARHDGTGDDRTCDRALPRALADLGWQENVVYDGVAAAVARLAGRGETLYLCTSKPRLRREDRDHFGLRPFLDGVTGPTSPAHSTTRRCSSLTSSRARASIPGPAR